MRRPSFKGWVSRELVYLSGENTINLRRLAFLAQNSEPRLWERLVLYAITTDQASRLRGYLYRGEMIAELDVIIEQVKGLDFNYPDNIENLQLPPRYQKAMHSYAAAYHRIDIRNASKKLRWQKSVDLQKKKGISNAEISRSLGLDAGNINAYLKYADINRISLETATEIMKYLYSVNN